MSEGGGGALRASASVPVAGERGRGGHQAAVRWRVGAVLRCEFGVVGHEGTLLSANRLISRPESYENTVVVTTMFIRKPIKKA